MIYIAYFDSEDYAVVKTHLGRRRTRCEPHWADLSAARPPIGPGLQRTSDGVRELLVGVQRRHLNLGDELSMQAFKWLRQDAVALPDDALNRHALTGHTRCVALRF